MRSAAWILVVLFALGGAASAQEEKVVLDQWTEQFVGGVKLGYAHTRIVETGSGFQLEWTEWTPVQGGLHVQTTQTRTDADGRILERTVTETTALGTSRTRVKRENDGVLRWSRQRRALPRKTGEIRVPVHHSDIVVYLIARGDRKPGKRTINTLDLPVGTEKTDIISSRKGKTTTVTIEKKTLRFDERGWLKDVHHSDVLATQRSVSEAEAKDMTRKPPGPSHPRIKRGKGSVLGMNVQHPGLGWAMVVSAPKSKNNRVMLVHPNGVILMSEALAVPLPEDPAALLDAAKGYMAEINKSPDGDMKLAKPTAEKAWGCSSVRFDLEARMKGDAFTGSAWLIRHSPAQLALVFAMSYSDLTKQTAPLLALAKTSFTLTPPAPAAAKKPATGTQAISFACGLSLKVPAGWKKTTRRTRTVWRGTDGSEVGAWAAPNAAADPKAIVEQWAATTAARLKTQAPPAEALKLGTREAWGVPMKVTSAGMTLKLRLIVAPHRPAGVVMLMVVTGFNTPAKAADEIVKSASWDF